MDSIFGNLRTTSLVGLLTPVRQKNNCKLRVSKQVNARCKSDSSSPLPDCFFNDNSKEKVDWNDENFSIREKKQNFNSGSHPRTPLQTLNIRHTVVSKSAPKVSSLINKCTTGMELTCGTTPKCQGFVKIELSNFLSNTTSRTLDCHSSIKWENKINSLPNADAVCERSKTCLLNENSNLHLQGRTKRDFVSSFCTPTWTSNAHSVCVENTMNRPIEYMKEFESLPPVEIIGCPFWGEDVEANVEEAISLDDMIQSANIWDIMENNCSNLSLDSPPEPKLEQDTIFQQDTWKFDILQMEPPSIEIPRIDLEKNSCSV